MGQSQVIFQLVYASIALHQFSSAELARVLELARKKNAERHLTGVLLYEGGTFVQALEGAEPDVRHVFAKIGADPRHRGVQQLWCGPVAARSFGDWSMGFVDGANTEVRQLDGYRDFFGRQSLSSFWSNPSRATDLLSEFRQLPWREALAEARLRDR